MSKQQAAPAETIHEWAKAGAKWMRKMPNGGPIKLLDENVVVGSYYARSTETMYVVSRQPRLGYDLDLTLLDDWISYMQPCNNPL